MDNYKNLQEDIKEEEEINQQYFKDLLKEPLKVSKHLLRVSERFFLNATELIAKDEIESAYSLFGVSFELLLKSILLKNNISIIPKLEDKKTISFKKCLACLEPLLKDIEEKEKQRINEVLNLINLRRNNYIHLSYSGFESYSHPMQVLLVFDFLVKYFLEDFERDKFLKEKMQELKEKYKVYPDTLDFQPVDFDKYLDN